MRQLGLMGFFGGTRAPTEPQEQLAPQEQQVPQEQLVPQEQPVPEEQVAKSGYLKYNQADFKEWGEKGGRPPTGKQTQKERALRRKAKRSNAQHYVSKKVEPTAVERLAIVKSLKEERAKYTDEHEYWREMALLFEAGRDAKKKEVRKRIVKQLKSYMEREEEDEKFVQDKKLGQLGGRRRGDATPAYLLKDEGKMARRMGEQGAQKTGVRNHFEEIIQELRVWVKREERYGHDLDQEDLVDEYEELISKDLLLLLATEKERTLTPQEADAKEAFKHRLGRLQEQDYAYTMRGRLGKTLQIRTLMPTRVSTLGLQEEELRAILTWQMFDQKLYMCAFGPRVDLELEVFGIEKWEANIEEIVLEFEDEIPFWIAVGRTKKIVTKELHDKMRKVQCEKKSRQRWKIKSRIQEKQLRHVKKKLKRSSKDETDIVQGSLTSGQERMRLTIVDRSIVEHYFKKDGRPPVGKRLKMIVVFPGAWANMANMELKEPYNIIDEERLLVDGVEQIRPAGSNSKGRMKRLCKLREEEPELWQHAETMQSPSSNRDEVS